MKQREITNKFEIKNMLEEALFASNFEVKKIYGLLGYIRIYDFTFICVITEIKHVGEVIKDKHI